jgi:CHAT domain-containing protein/tetratricopeptide (TPR) repeat protein
MVVILPLTWAEFDDLILEHHGLLESLPRSDPHRPALLFQLVGLRIQRFELERERSDFEKAITHMTEAVLLSSSQKIVFALFHLAAALLKRFTCYRQPDDIKYSMKYFRFLRINFHSLDSKTFDPPQETGDLSSGLFHTLAYNLVLTPGDMVQDLEEMAALIPEVITADILTDQRKCAIEALGEVVNATEMFCREDTKQVADRAIQALREAMALNPDLDVSLALARCLAARFETTLVMNDYEEAIANADRIVATHSSGNSLTMIQGDAMMLITALLASRWNSFSRPEYLEDAIQRIRTFIPCFPDQARDVLTKVLNDFMRQRFNYSGVTGTAGGTPHNHRFDIITEVQLARTVPGVGQEHETTSQVHEKLLHLKGVATAIINGEMTDVEAAVERNRKLLPLWQPKDQLSLGSSYCLVHVFAGILVEAYQCTKRSEYLDEAITTCRDLRKMSAQKVAHFDVGLVLLKSLMERFKLSPRGQDFEELMQLFSTLANDHSGELFTRFNISCFWATVARRNLQLSTSMVYEIAMSLLQEALVFSPTLQTQHLYLARVFKEGWRLPSDYASYQIEDRQVEQAVETLERGTALIWSEMRGLRTSTDQLRAADPALADKFVDVNRRLESVTMSVAQSDDDGIGRNEAGTGRREHTIGHLVLAQRTLLEERDSFISHIQSLPGLEKFLKSPSFDLLNSAASHGPVIIVNQSRCFSSHIILLLKDSPPSVISTPSNFKDRANQLENNLLRVRKEKGLDSEDYGLTLASVLSDLYELVGKPVVERLRQLGVPDKSRVWWCPTGAFCSLPLHAMGPIPSDDGNDLYFSDLYIPSYTPTLSALIESRKRGSFSEVVDNSKPSILLVAQPETLPGAFGEINAIKSTKTQVTTLISAMATPETVIKGLREHRFAHFVCHGLLETGKPFNASLELHKAYLTLLAIVRSQLPAAEFAFLAACHTAELTEGSVADEGLHLSAAMQYCGFRSVVGTLWAMADTDGADLSRHFYKTIFSDKAVQDGVPYHERSAQALQIAVQKLRKKRGMTLERWVNFVHYGA